MAYTALEKMRTKNRAAYGKDVGPAQPALSAADWSGQTSNPLRFASFMSAARN